MEIRFGGTATPIETSSSKRPIVNRYTVGVLISSRKTSISSVERQLAESGFVEATAEPLQQLLDAKDPNKTIKFLREAERVILGEITYNHVDYAIVAGIIPDDAGFIGRNPLQPSQLIVMGGSDSLRIPVGNTNRPATVDILKTIAPDIQIMGNSNSHI